MAGNGGIVVIEEALDVELLRDGKTSSFGIVTLCKVERVSTLLRMM